MLQHPQILFEGTNKLHVDYTHKAIQLSNSSFSDTYLRDYLQWQGSINNILEEGILGRMWHKIFSTAYRIVGNFGEVFNLAIWRNW